MNRVGIIGAMEEEVEVLKKQMKIKERVNIANMDFYTGILCNQNIVLVRCGIGKVNAAICTQILIGQLGVNTVINTGVAGAVKDNLEVLDIVISTDVQHHDFDARSFGYNIGEIPRMETSIFKADEHLIDMAYQSAEKIMEKGKVFKGKIVSGDVFVGSSLLKDKLNSNFQAYCTEMEGAAIGHTCFLNNIPFVIIRTMSDKADGSAHANFNEFMGLASNYSKDIVVNILQDM